MKIGVVASAIFSVSLSLAHNQDVIKKAIENHNPARLLQFNVKEIAQLANQKKDYMHLADKAAEQAKLHLQKRFDWRDKMRLLGGVALAGMGGYLLKRYAGFLINMNDHCYYENNTPMVKESLEKWPLAGEGLGGPGGLLLLALGMNECYKGVTASDRKRDFARSLQVKDAIDDWGNVLS